MSSVAHEHTTLQPPHEVKIYKFAGDLTLHALASVFGDKPPLHVRQMDESRVGLAIQTGTDRDENSPHWIHPLDAAAHTELANLGPQDYTNASRVNWEDNTDDKWYRGHAHPFPENGRAVLVLSRDAPWNG